MDSLQNSARRREGYTLVELMMIVMIIAISMVAFAPGFGRAMTNRHVSTAARELIRIGRRARSDSFGYLRAHLIWIQPASARVQLLRGPTNSCLLPQWHLIQADCAARAQRCLEDLDLTRWVGRSLQLREQLVNGAYATTRRALCYGPTGIVMWGTGNDLEAASAALTETNSVNGGFLYTLHAGSGDPGASDSVHRVLFPLGSTPRSLR